MATIVVKGGGCILINDQPYQVGDFRIKYEGDSVLISEKLNTRNIVLNTLFNQIINPVTGEVFDSIAALKSFIEDNFFFDSDGGGGIGSGSMFRVTTPSGSQLTALTNTKFKDGTVLKIERTGGSTFFIDTEFNHTEKTDTIVMIGIYTLQPSTTYFVTIE